MKKLRSVSIMLLDLLCLFSLIAVLSANEIGYFLFEKYNFMSWRRVPMVPMLCSNIDRNFLISTVS